MAKFHVEHNAEAGAIFVGKIKRNNKWVEKIDATDEVMEAVRDHLMFIRNMQNDEPPAIGYRWMTQDGKIITLQLVVDEIKDD